jgi:Leucine Rich repeat
MALAIPLDVLHELFMALCKDVGERPSQDEAVQFKKRMQMRCRDAKVDMREMRIGPSTTIALAKALTINTNSHTPPSEERLALGRTVEKIDLYGNGIRNAGAIAMAQLLSTTQCHIKEANMGCNEIDDEGGRVLGMALRVNNTVKRLELGAEGPFWHDNALGPDAGVALGEGLERNQTLTYLGLNHNFLGRENGRGIDALARALRASECPLTVLKLAKNEMTSRQASGLLEALTTNEQLTLLDVSRNKLTPDLGSSFADVVRSHGRLTSLSVSFCNLGARGVALICEAMSTRTCALTSFNADGNECGDEGAAAIASMLEVNHRVFQVLAASNGITSAGGAKIARALLNHGSLGVLSLRKNRLGNATAIEFAEALAACDGDGSVLRKLDLSGTQLGGAGGVALAQACRDRPDAALVSLKLADNFLTEADGARVVELLRQNRKVLEVNLKGNQLNHKTELEAKRLCQVNRQRKKNADIAPLRIEMARLKELEARLPDKQTELKREHDLVIQAQRDAKDAVDEKARNKKEASQNMQQLKQELVETEAKAERESEIVAEREADLDKLQKEFDSKIESLLEAIATEMERKKALENELEEKTNMVSNIDKQHAEWVEQTREHMEQLRVETETLREQATVLEPELATLTAQAKASGKKTGGSRGRRGSRR